MAETMSMNRVIHHAVRRDLARLEAALASAPDGDVTRAVRLDRAYDNLHRELTRHHEGEDAFVFPFLAEVGLPSDLLAAMDHEHHDMADALGQTRAAMAAYASNRCSSRTWRPPAGRPSRSSCAARPRWSSATSSPGSRTA
jgi:iron-sulfur cluster repair protein YtfE (RIC family)